MEVKTKKLLTRPVLKFVEGTPHHVLIEGAMYVGKDMPSKEGEKKKEPATLMDVTDLETGEACQIVVNAVVKSVLSESYPDASYVGKCFSITKQGKQPGKQYNAFSIAEIEDPRANAPAASAAVEPAAPTKTSHKR